MLGLAFHSFGPASANRWALDVGVFNSSPSRPTLLPDATLLYPGLVCTLISMQKRGSANTNAFNPHIRIQRGNR